MSAAKPVTFDELRAVERMLRDLSDREWEAAAQGCYGSSGVVCGKLNEAQAALWEAMRERALDERLDALAKLDGAR